VVGRPDVGRWSLSNRLITRRDGTADESRGATRDRHHGSADWDGREFSIIDTGGYVVGSDDIFEQEIDKQVELALDEADAIIFVVDVATGITGMDEEVAELLRQVEKPIFVAVNKVDSALRVAD